MSEEKKVYELIIVGAGPAGLSAGIYASRYKIENLILGPEVGGTITKAHLVENYPGFESIPGLELGQKMATQAQKLGSELKLETVTSIVRNNNEFSVKTNNDKTYYSKSLIVASGTERRKLNIQGEDQYLGRGVSYCTNCDAPFFKNKKVAVIGGGDSAVTGALHLNDIASETYLVYRRAKDDMKAEPIWIEALEKGKTKCLFETNTLEILGDGQKVTGLKLNKDYEGKNEIAVDGVFIEIGAVPISKLVGNLGVTIDSSGFIVVDEEMKTNIEGVYAAGDITTTAKILTQAITAAAQGATAAATAFKTLKGKTVAPKQWG